MTEKSTTEGTAESLLQKLQAVLEGAAGGEPGTRAALRATERAHGAQATRYGRLLNDLVADSHAWDLWEGPPTRGARLPRLHELSVSEPLLQLMRESGELAERERLLRERDAALAAAWGRARRTKSADWMPKRFGTTISTLSRRRPKLTVPTMRRCARLSPASPRRWPPRACGPDSCCCRR